MTQKKKHTLRGFSLNEIPHLDENFRDLYQNKLESVELYDNSASANSIRTYQAMIHGYAYFSANGSAITTRSFAIRSTFEQLIYASAHARHANILASVTDLTNTSITIQARANIYSSTSVDAFSLTTTASVAISWQILGSAP